MASDDQDEELRMAGSRNDRGQVLVVVALAATALILVASLVVDGGFAWARHREAQSAADFAALAATRVVSLASTNAAIRNADVYQAIVTTAAANNGATVPGLGTAEGAVYVDRNGASIAIAVTNDSGAVPPSARGVRVQARRVYQPVLLGVLGGATWNPTAAATARALPSAAATCVFCVIGSPSGPHFYASSGQTLLSVSGGPIASNPLLELQANPTISSISVNGSPSGVAVYHHNPGLVCNNCVVSPAVTNMTTLVPDPLLGIPNPVATGTNHGSFSAPGPGTTKAAQPGIYQTMTVGANATVNLAPGTYYFTGDLTIESNGTVSGTGVTLVFMGQANVHTQSNGALAIAAPPPTSTTATFPGLAIYFARGNGGTLQLQSSSTQVITGTIYAPNAFLDTQTGTGMQTANSLVVIGTVNMQSSSKVQVNYTGDQNVQLPSGGATLVQ
jgi:Flp pilus assembly protein TadG